MKQNLSILRLSVVLLAAAYSVLSGYANGDPVVRYSSINRVANPEPLSISEIRIVREDIKITHEDGYNCFDITYQFENRSDKDFPAIDYGFPIDYLVEDEREIHGFSCTEHTSIPYEIGWNDLFIKDVNFKFNSETLKYQSAKETVREAGYEITVYGEYVDSMLVDGIDRRWYYTQFAMSPHSIGELNVHYKVLANSVTNTIVYPCDMNLFSSFRVNGDDIDFWSNKPVLYRYFYDKFNIVYDFTPAKHFGDDREYHLNVDIDLSNLDNPKIHEGDCTYYVNRIKKDYYWAKASELKPLDLEIYLERENSTHNIERIIEPLIVSPDSYHMKNYGDSVLIDFLNPIFVTEIACDIDTALVKVIDSEINYNDGRHVKFSNESGNPELQCQKLLSSPAFLIINDFEDKSKEERYKVKSIKLIFNHESSDPSKPIADNIRVLDARFDKRKPE
ncbi:MAG: hypothetical protein K2N28_00145 [Muribaculaceae bacterium]|nr:hypothetical protein [Muribaculaceae bacterium]